MQNDNILTFVIPNTLFSIGDVPSLGEGLKYEIYDVNENIFVLSGQSVNTQQQIIANGLAVSTQVFAHGEDAGLEEGKYNIIVEVILPDKNYAYSELYTKEGTQEPVLPDVFTWNDAITVPIPSILFGDSANFTGKCTLYQENEVLQSVDKTNAVQVELNLEGLEPSLNQRSLILETSSGLFSEIRLWKINPSILSALGDLRAQIDRLNRELLSDTLVYQDTDYLLLLRFGRDRFNSLPIPTDIDMTEAEGPIRALWLNCSLVQALRTRNLEEGLANFDYSASSVSLSVDITTALEGYASELESKIQEEGNRLKIDLHKRGLAAGTGKWALGGQVIGVFGRALSPVSGRFSTWRPRL